MASNVSATPAATAPNGPASATTAHQRAAREIYATHTHVDNEPCVRVYQAYNEKIATAAAAANSFVAPKTEGTWSAARISWVKPSAAWMAYRCGWTTCKDENQAHVLALDLDQKAFEAVLMEAVVTHNGADVVPGAIKQAPVRVQWDPERELDPTCPDEVARGKPKGNPFLRQVEGVRSLQVGIKETERVLCNPLVVRRITDVTPAFREAHAALARGDLSAAEAALWPDAAMRERQMDVPMQLRAVLNMDEREQ